MRQCGGYERRTGALRPLAAHACRTRALRTRQSRGSHHVRLKRVYIDRALSPGAALELPQAAALHLAKVVRVRSGDPLVLFTGDGREFAATVESARGPRVTAAVGEARSVDRESPLAITLTQCIAR